LTSGNIGLLKHAPNVFGCAKLIEEIFVKLDTQKMFSKKLTVHHDQIEQIIAHQTVKLQH
jgi:succinate-semialdehyde dehydrogenase/glutarate-semialdehyde dehydrogenase